MAKTCVALRHVHFEDLGSFEAPIRAAGYSIRYCDMGMDAVADAGDPDLLAVLGAPIGACEEALYPFLADEIALIRARLAAQKPLLGICLGAQLMAMACGKRVYPGRVKEIGWLPLTLSADSDVLAPLAGLPVLHWHGDTFDLPQRAIRLASSPLYENQAFACGRNALALQFHVEADPARLEEWYVGHTAELGAAGISVNALRTATTTVAGRVGAQAEQIFKRWLNEIG